jgi:hypothetical protein
MSSRLALLILPLALISCRKAETTTPSRPSDTTVSALPELGPSVPPTDSVALAGPSVSRSFDSLVRSLPREQGDSVRIWQTRLDSLRAAWDRDMAEETPLPDFAKHPWDYPLPYPSHERPEWARLFRGIDGCAGDSIFDVYRVGGDLDGSEPESHSFVVAPGFSLPGGIRQGMSSAEAIQALGNPYRNGDGYLSWAIQDWGEMEHAKRVVWHEALRFFFLDNRLVAVWIVHPVYGC